MSQEASTARKIWIVFGILSAITLVEVFLGIIRPEILVANHIVGTTWLNFIFLALTILKAFYIVWEFMHLGHEVKALKYAVVAPVVFLVVYLAFFVLVEGAYIADRLKDFTHWEY